MLGALIVTALGSAYTAVEAHKTRKGVEAERAEKRKELDKQEAKMEEDIAKQKEKQAKDLELQKAKETRKAKRGASGYAGSVLTGGIKPGSAVTKRATLGVG
jgi:hypothetical protein